MTELILRINNPLELDQLLPILKQLKINSQTVIHWHTVCC